MKKVLIFCLFLMSFQGFSQKTPQGIVDYFNLLPQDLRVYDLKQKNGKFYSQDPSTDTELSPTVDTKNGFIQIESEGTGGGVHQITVVLYRKANKDAVIGFSERTFDGMIEEFKFSFFEYKNNRYTDITSQVMPKLSHEDFLKNKIDLKKYKTILEKSPICIELPRSGTTAKSRVSNFLIEYKCESESEQDKKLACELRNKFFTNIDLVWDKAKGKFSLGTKK